MSPPSFPSFLQKRKNSQALVCFSNTMYNPGQGGGGGGGGMGGGHDINPSTTTTSTMNSGGGNTGEALHASHFTRQRRAAVMHSHVRSSSSSGGHLHDLAADNNSDDHHRNHHHHHRGVYGGKNSMMSSGSNNNKRDFSHSKRTFRKQTLFGIVFGIVMMIALALGASLLAKVFVNTNTSSSPSSLSKMNNNNNKRAEHAGVFSPVAEGDSRVERFMAKSNCTLNFFLAWTTSAAKFSLRYRRTVESTLKFHPGACLIVYSPTMQLDHFQRFWDLGYNIIVERPDVPYLIRGTPAEAWYQGIDKWKNGEYFFSHITEIIRLATLWKYGGVYLDTDVVVMRELDNLHNAVGTELADERGEAKVLNGAVLAFRKGSTFIHECMVEFNTTYRIDSWGWNGPQLVTRVAARFPQGPELQILPTIGFYPIHWAKVRKYFTDEDPADQHAVWERMKRETYLFHYWNKITVKLVPTPGSLMYKVLNNYCLFCEETGMDG